MPLAVIAPISTHWNQINEMSCHLVGTENDDNKLCLQIKWVQARD